MAVFSRWRREGRRPSGGIGDIERTDGTTLLEVLEALANIGSGRSRSTMLFGVSGIFPLFTVVESPLNTDRIFVQSIHSVQFRDSPVGSSVAWNITHSMFRIC